MYELWEVSMGSIKKLYQKTSQWLARVWELMPLRSLWEIWALANVFIIVVLVIESIWLPNLNDTISRTVLEFYLGHLPQCKSEAHTAP